MSKQLVNLNYVVQASGLSMEYILYQIMTIDGREDCLEVTTSYDHALLQHLAKVLNNAFRIGLLAGRVMERDFTEEEVRKFVNTMLEELGLSDDPE